MLALLQTTTLYKIVVTVHILCAIVGIGTMVLNGVYGAVAKKRPATEGAAIVDANYTVSMIAEKFIYALFVTGVIAVLVSKDAVKFETTWVWVSTVLYVAAIGISHAVTLPAARSTKQLLAEVAADPAKGAEHGAELGRLDKRLAASSSACVISSTVAPVRRHSFRTSSPINSLV